MMRVCSKCGLLKPIDLFGKLKNGPNGYRSACKKCCKELRQAARDTVNAAKANTRQKKVGFARRVKLKFGCARCGYKQSPYALQFHHIDPSSKKFTIASTNGRDRSMEKIKEEMRKCEILCANCHAIQTYEDLYCD